MAQRQGASGATENEDHGSLIDERPDQQRPSPRPDETRSEGQPTPSPAPPGSGEPQTRRRARTEALATVADRIHPGPLIAGVGLVIFGLLLLGGTDFAWRGLLDAALAGIGLALVLGSRRAASRQRLIMVGLVVAVVLLGVWRADVPLQGGMRFHTVTPIAPQDVATSYRQTAGTLTVDLTRYPPSPVPLPPINASVGVGRLVVVVLPGTVLQGSAVVGGGRVSVGSVDKNGVGLDVPLAAPNAPARAQADLRVGVGDLEVQVGKPH